MAHYSRTAAITSLTVASILLDAFDRHCSLTLELLLIAVLLFLLTILQPGTIVRFQHAVLPAKLSFTEAAVTDYSLRCIFAIFEVTTNLLRRSSSDWQCHV